MLIRYNLIPLFCSRLVFINWLQSHLLPCPFKYLTGIDCPGCGFQRSVLALARGNFNESFMLYPPAVPILLFFLYGLADKHFKLDNKAYTIKKNAFYDCWQHRDSKLRG